MRADDVTQALYTFYPRDIALWGDYWCYDLNLDQTKSERELQEAVCIARFEAESGDGQSVEVWCTRAPAQFFEIRVLPTRDSCGRAMPGFTLQTGSSCGALAFQIAQSASEGMLGLVVNEPDIEAQRGQAIAEITEVIAGHGTGHNNTPEQWRDNAERVFGIVERVVKSDFLQQSQTAESFQSRVQPWMLSCFGPAITFDPHERNERFLEEALELVQAMDYTREQALKMVDYVYNRPKGEPYQEVGGVMITLAAFCEANQLNMNQCAEQELARVWTKVEQIREKQKGKPSFI